MYQKLIKIQFLLCFLLLSWGSFAQTAVKAFGYSIEAPKDWKIIDEQKNFNFVETHAPNFAGKIVVKEKKGKSDMMMRSLISEIDGLAFQLGMDRTILNADYIGEKLQTYSTEEGLELLTFEYWERKHDDGKQRYMLLFVARDGDQMVIFSGTEVAKENGTPPTNYTTVRRVLEGIKK